MSFTDIDIYQQRRGGANDVAAHLVGVRVELARTASQIGTQASALLGARSGQTRERYHDLPSPRITVSEGKKLDWFVFLEADGPDGQPDLMRAIGIEFGHKYESARKNGTGPWGKSSGLGVLADAAKYVSYAKWGGDK